MNTRCRPFCDGLDFQPYDPRFSSRIFVWTGLRKHLQTFIAPLTRVSLPDSKREQFVMPDGNPDVLLADYHPSAETGRPLVLLLHGLPGDRETWLIRNAAYTFLRRGYPVLRLGLRGSGDQAGKTQMLYHAGRTEDIHEVIRQLPDKEWYRDQVLVVGYSFGANMTLKLLGEDDPTGHILGGAASCGPIDLRYMTDTLSKLTRLGRIYEWYFLRLVKKEVGRHQRLTPAQREAIEAARSFAEFDEHFFAQFSGFANAADYYARSSASNYLSKIQTPVLILHSSEDPIVPMRPYLEYFANHRRPNLCPVLDRPGGHAAFLDGLLRPMSWQHVAMADFFDEHFG